MKELIIQADSLPTGKWELWRPKDVFLAVEAPSTDQFKYRDTGTPQYVFAKKGEIVVFERDGEGPAQALPPEKFAEDFELGPENRAVPRLQVRSLRMTRPFRIIRSNGKDECGEPGDHVVLLSTDTEPFVMTLADLQENFLQVRAS